MTQRDAVDVAGPCETPMSDHVERFFQMLEGGTVRVLVDTEQWHSASFPDDVAKAIAAAYRSASNSGAEAFRSAVKAHIQEVIEATRKACDAAWAEYTPELGLHAINVYEAILVSIDAALPLPAPCAPASPWRVKKLKWRKPADHPQDPEDAALVAIGIGGQYAISKPQLTAAFGPNGHLLWDAEDNFSFTEHRTIADAQAAAQADFERCIRSAIEPDLPTPPASKDT